MGSIGSVCFGISDKFINVLYHCGAFKYIHVRLQTHIYFDLLLFSI